MPEDTPPGRVGRFEIRRELGRGTMGVVFEAHDPTLHRTVALKVIRLAFAANAKEKGDFERRFLVEARAAASLSHPGIVVVHEAGRDAESGMLYLALEHLEGRALSELIAEKGRFEEGAALRLAAQVARALDYAHRRGVVHRDVKPANVMVLPDGQAKILDFGLAKLDAGHEQTAAGQFLGTPLFVSPEQALGLPVDGRSDLFSLGAILYTMLAGRRPFEGETLARILNRVAHQPPRALREANPAVSPAAERIVMRALEKEARDRHPTGAAMAEDLEDALAGRSPRHAGRPGAAAGAAALLEDEKNAEAEGTVVALRAAGAGVDEQGLPELALDDAPPPPESFPVRRRRPGPLRAVSLTLLLGGLAFFYTANSGPERLAEALVPFLTDSARPLGMRARAAPTAPSPLEPSPVPTSTSAMPSDPSPDPTSEPSPSPWSEAALAGGPAPTSTEAAGAGAASEVDAEPEAPVLLPDEGVEAAPAAAEATDPQAAAQEAAPEAALEAAQEAAPEAAPPGKPEASPPSAVPTPPPSVPPRSSSRPAAPPKAELAIHLEHPLTRGTVRVWLDDKLVLREPLSSTVSKKILFFAFRSGRVRETLEIPPGKHRLRVEVRGKDRADSAQTTAEFKPRVRRRLYVRPGARRGRLAFGWR